MTDTTKPPNRPTSSRPRPFVRAGGERPGGDEPRGGRQTRGRPAGDRDAAPPRRDPTSKTRGVEPAPPKDDARIAKVMARAGLCSRRDAEGWIAAGRVAVNGAVIDSPALNVKPGDRITVDGEPLPEREQTRLFLFHKPRGLVTTARDPEGRPTIFDHLPEGLPRVVSIGRLDINTEGLMLLTNDGGLARVLELPATGWLRRYRVRANGAIDQAKLDGLKSGVTIDGVDYAGIEATLDRIQGANAWLTMGLREGKNREIKRVLESLGLAVTRLIRISFGPFQLGELGEGAVESVPTRVLREQLGPGLAAQAGVDLEPRDEPAARRGAPGLEGVAPTRPKRGEPPAPRPHVAALRAAREDAAGDGRKRIERGATADRKGRAVTVERVIPVGTGSERDGGSRNARRFAAEKQDFVAGRQKTRADAGSSRRGAPGAVRPRREADERPARAAADDGGRGGRAGGFAAQPRGVRTADPREGRGETAASRPRGAPRPAPFGDRPRRVDAAPVDGEARREPRGRAGASRAGRTADPGETRGKRPGGFGTKPRSDGPAGFGTKPRSDGPAGFGAKLRSDGPAGFGAKLRSEGPTGLGDKPRNERSGGFGAKPRSEGPAGFGDKPRSGKPHGRAGGFGSERPATGRNKPAGARPSGPRPPGGRPSGARPSGGDRPKGGRPPRARP